MTAIPFDALAFCKIIQAGGFSREQAEALATAQQQALKEAVAARDIASKADLELGLAKLQAEMSLKLAETKTSLVKWMISLFIAQLAAILAIFALLPQFSRLMAG